MKITKEDIIVLAQTIYGEARGEYHKKGGGLPSLIAVGNVIFNRANQGTRFGTSISEVCKKPYQFSCWNPSDPNKQLIETKRPDCGDMIFDLCYKVAESILTLNWPDLTKGSNHYHAPLKKLPAWAMGQKILIQIGSHSFYKL